MKRILFVLTIVCLTVIAFAGCNNLQGIAVVSREEGSGTRGAFEELIGFKASEGDDLPAGATTLTSTGAVLTSVAGNKNGLGYISLGSLNETTVKAVKVNDVAATSENVLDGTYPLYRPFLIVSGKTEAEMTDLEKDFYDFLQSTQAQTIISAGYISTREGTSYSPSYPTGTGRGSDPKFTVSGSTSVQPIMNSLAGKYLELNPGLSSSDIEISGGGSGTGINNAIGEVTVFGMSSRELKANEEAELETIMILCKDGIAVIVNKNNALNNVTVAELKKIYVGEITRYSELSDLQ